MIHDKKSAEKRKETHKLDWRSSSKKSKQLVDLIETKTCELLQLNDDTKQHDHEV